MGRFKWKALLYCLLGVCSYVNSQITPFGKKYRIVEHVSQAGAVTTLATLDSGVVDASSEGVMMLYYLYNSQVKACYSNATKSEIDKLKEYRNLTQFNVNKTIDPGTGKYMYGQQFIPKILAEGTNWSPSLVGVYVVPDRDVSTAIAGGATCFGVVYPFETFATDSVQNAIRHGKVLADLEWSKDSKRIMVNFYQKNMDPGMVDSIHYYKPKNRKFPKFKFSHWSVAGITVPLKGRLDNDDTDADVEWSRDVNAGLMVGYSSGSEVFKYRKGISNLNRVRTFTVGGIVGVGSLEFEDAEGESIKTAYGSLGVGGFFSIDRITLGAVSGFDFALGDGSGDWDYNWDPYLGLAAGIKVFGG